MTREEYIEAILKLYRVANASDTENAEDWIEPTASQFHCGPLGDLLREIAMNDEEFASFIDRI